MEWIIWIVASLVGGCLAAMTLSFIADDQAHQDKMRNDRPWEKD